jgi:hypothetical protein
MTGLAAIFFAGQHDKTATTEGKKGEAFCGQNGVAERAFRARTSSRTRQPLKMPKRRDRRE